MKAILLNSCPYEKEIIRENCPFHKETSGQRVVNGKWDSLRAHNSTKSIDKIIFPFGGLPAQCREKTEFICNNHIKDTWSYLVEKAIEEESFWKTDGKNCKHISMEV